MSRVRVYILLTSKIKLHRVTTLAKREAYLKRLKFKLYREKMMKTSVIQYNQC